MKVGIVGGGACGLCMARILRRRGLSVTVFESHSRPGGIWCVGKEDSQLYAGLRTNLPKELMAFPGHPFPSHLPSFVTSADMDNYLTAYAKDICVELNRRVVSVVPESEKSERPTWKVSWVKNGEGVAKDEQQEKFDAIIVANGHFNVPFIPADLERQAALWQGTTSHSKAYERPEAFKDKVVVVVGAKSSGTDIAKELDGIAKQVHVCDPSCPENETVLDNKGKPVCLEKLAEQFYKVPDTRNVFWRPKLVGLVPGTKQVQFSSGPDLVADHVIFCTGYKFAFEFLPQGLLQTSQGKRVRPIYRELMHERFTNLFFAGLNQPIVPFPFFQVQAEWIASMLLHPEWVAPWEVRYAHVNDIDARVQSGEIRDVHALPDQWDYLLGLAQEARLPDIPALRMRFDRARAMYKVVSALRPVFPGANDTYRDYDFSKSTSQL